jgi:AraC-like DNA-binding protein
MAVEYIVSTRKTFTEIAALCGFNNSTNFNKAFKKITGNSPSYYRKPEKNG